MTDCKNCAHSIFDPLWGEYKCKVNLVRYMLGHKPVDCPDYEKKVNKKES